MHSLVALVMLAAELRVPFWRSTGEAVRSTDLQVAVNGSRTKPLRVSAANGDLMLLIVLDLAGDLSLVDPAREALVSEIGKLPANTTVGLLRAQDGLRVIADPGTGREKLGEVIHGLVISGRAGLLDTVETAAKLADGVLAKSRVRVAVLYVTDSLVSNYREDFTNPVVNSSDSGDMSRRFPEGLVKEKIRLLKEQLSVTVAPVFIVHVNYQNDRLNDAYQTGLLDLAVSTGGAAAFCHTVSDIASSLERTFTEIESQQTVDVDSPAKARQLEFSLEAEGRSLHYRQRLHKKGD